MEPVPVLLLLDPLQEWGAAFVAAGLAAGSGVAQEAVAPFYSRPEVDVDQVLTVAAVEGAGLRQRGVRVGDQRIPFPRA